MTTGTQAVQELALSFDCAGETLAGIVAAPATGATSHVGVVVIVGGPQYRVGSHRQFVLLARALAAAGHPVLRFDSRGMGDSTGELHDFLQVTEDIAAAIDALQRAQPGVRRVVLWGLCDAAAAALLYCHARRDARVQGLCLVNPWVRSEASLARTHVKHYYLQRLRQKEFWMKLLRGGVATSALGSLLRNLRAAFARQPGDGAAAAAQLPFQDRMAAAWRGMQIPMLLFLSGNDYTAKEFREYIGRDAAWAGALQRPGLSCHEEPGADHTLSQQEARLSAERQTLQLLARIA